MNPLRFLLQRFLPWLAALVAVACSRPSATPDPGVLAEIGDTRITDAMFREGWSKAPPTSDSLEARKALLERMVRHCQAVRRARALGIDREPAVMEEIDAILVARLRETWLKPKLSELSVSEAESRAYYEEFRDRQFRVPRRAHVAVLWLDTRGTPPLAARYKARLEEVRAALAEQAADSDEVHFGSWAITHSEHRASRFHGGDIGWVDLEEPSADPWRKAVAEIAATLSQPGEVSQVVAREEGVFLARLIALAPAGHRTYEEVRSKIEQLLLSRKQAAVRKEFEDWIAQEGPVGMDLDALAGVTDLKTRELTPPSRGSILTYSSLP